MSRSASGKIYTLTCGDAVYVGYTTKSLDNILHNHILKAKESKTDTSDLPADPKHSMFHDYMLSTGPENWEIALVKTVPIYDMVSEHFAHKQMLREDGYEWIF